MYKRNDVGKLAAYVFDGRIIGTVDEAGCPQVL
jgi:hypothetical protein